MQEKARVIVPVKGTWFIAARREKIYGIITDFESIPKNFPKIARSVRVLEKQGTRIVFDAQAASFGRWFPTVDVSVVAELIPQKGYRCKTHNRSFNTFGEEELLLVDVEGGTQIQYTYFVTVRNIRLAPFYSWLVHAFGLRFWKKHYVDRLIALTR